VAGGGSGAGPVVWGEEEEMMLGMGQTEAYPLYYIGSDKTVTDESGMVVGKLDASGSLVPFVTYSVTSTATSQATPAVVTPTPCKQTVFPTIKGFCDTYLWIGLAVLGGVLLMKGRR
jgi:hypothetical protein